MAQYVPWYLKQSPPVFCWPCVPVYTGIWPGRKCVLIIGGCLFAIGIMILLCLLLLCIAIECAAVSAGLLPLAIILILVGILLFHCGWAAHLLDYGGKVPTEEIYHKRTTRGVNEADDNGDDEEELVGVEVIEQKPQQPIKQGFWQFEQNDSWQNVTNPYPIQHTLKPVLDRQPYV
ncbi:unnamed protein product [Bursaphelenchus okinawaensis]|uniref:Uncharacterized protein n=1 Tax=Bursaphelenchus okinawaensis TaxID=465554 RepID=A0A811LAI0_9BILA|nr:unnamed protein product [Bursaphelenchus okinawaensis]CAG9119629.1 unnamed protein product [Bursaphelenchus okinawaensis]